MCGGPTYNDRESTPVEANEPEVVPAPKAKRPVRKVKAKGRKTSAKSRA